MSFLDIMNCKNIFSLFTQIKKEYFPKSLFLLYLSLNISFKKMKKLKFKFKFFKKNI